MTEIKWDLAARSKNPTVSIKEVLAKLDEPWDWQSLSCNPGIKFQDILTNWHLPWDWKLVSRNPNLTIEDVLTRRDWDWEGLSETIDLDDILKYPKLPWDMTAALDVNKVTDEIIDLPWDFASKYVTPEFAIRHRTKPWDWKSLTARATLTQIQDNPDIQWDKDEICLELTEEYMLSRSWDWIRLSYRSEVTIKVLLANRYKNWNWNQVSKNANITLADTQNDLPWVWMSILENPNINAMMLLDRVENWYHFSALGNITFDDVINNMSLPWRWDALSQRFPGDLILAHPDLPWKWKHVSNNPKVLFKHALQLPNIDWAEMTSKVSIEDICANPTFDWRWHMIYSRDITTAMVRTTSSWDWKVISELVDSKYSIHYVLKNKESLRKTSKPSDWWYNIIWGKKRPIFARQLVNLVVRGPRSDEKFFRISRKLPTELIERVCGAAYHLTWVPL